jgi:hypothetical protein
VPQLPPGPRTPAAVNLALFATRPIQTLLGVKVSVQRVHAARRAPRAPQLV